MSTEVGKLHYDLSIDDSKLKSGLDNADKHSESAFSRIGAGAAKAGAAIAAGLAVGAIAIGTLATKAIQETARLEQSIGGAATVFGEYGEVIKEFARESSFYMGTSMSQTLDTANKMGSLFQGAGFSVFESMNMSTTAMQRATDVATAMGISTEMALESIAGAAKGNFTMMDNLGVKMTATSIEAYALSKGITKSFDAMTEGEKIGLAMQMFMEQTAKYAGNYAKENETLSGSFQTLKASWTNFLSGVEGGSDQLIESIENMMNVVVKKLPEILPRLVSGLGSVINSLIKTLPQLLTSLLPAVVNGITGLVNSLVSVLPQLIPILIPAGVQLFMGLLTGLVKAIPTIIQGLTLLITTLVTELSKPENIQLILQGAFQLMMGIINALPLIMDSITKALPTLIIAITDFLTQPENIKQMIKAGVKLFMGLVSAAPQIAVALGSALWQVVKTAGENLKDGFKEAINWIIRKWNDMKFTIGGQEIFGKKIPSQTIETPNIPELAKGGVVTRPTVALIGEAGPEAVVPLSKANNPNGIGMGGDTYNFNFSGMAATSKQALRDMSQEIFNAFNEGLRSQGKKEVGTW